MGLYECLYFTETGMDLIYSKTGYERFITVGMRVRQVPFPPAIVGAALPSALVTVGEEIHGATHKNVAIGLCQFHK